MTEMISVPRSEVMERLGLPITATDDELRQALSAAAAAIAAQEAAQAVAAAEANACAEDERIVNAAIADGRLSEGRKAHWLNALGRNRAANRELIAVLTPTPAFLRPQSRKVAAAAAEATTTEAERVHNEVLSRLGIRPQPSPRTVAAASSTPPPAREPLVDMVGQPTRLGAPDPVLLSKGTNPDDWTWQQQSDFFQRHILGGKFAVGTRPTPQVSDVYYLPSPADPYELVDGQWRAKNPYKEIP